MVDSTADSTNIEEEISQISSYSYEYQQVRKNGLTFSFEAANTNEARGEEIDNCDVRNVVLEFERTDVGLDNFYSAILKVLVANKVVGRPKDYKVVK